MPMTSTPAFVVRALAYSLGAGALSLRGSRCRPWLEIRRRETETAYLDHQLRSLRRLCGPGSESRVDLLPGDRIYGTVRGRFHHPDLLQAYRLLYPQDTFQLTGQVLQMVGLEGLAALWLDGGRYCRNHPQLLGLPQFQEADWMLLRAYLRASRQPTDLLFGGRTRRSELTHRIDRPIRGLRLLGPRRQGSAPAPLLGWIEPHVHRSMRHTLQPPNS